MTKCWLSCHDMNSLSSNFSLEQAWKQEAQSDLIDGDATTVNIGESLGLG